MSDICLACNIRFEKNQTILASGSVRSRATSHVKMRARVSSSSRLLATARKITSPIVSLRGESGIRSRPNITLNPIKFIRTNNGGISAFLNNDIVARSRITGSGDVKSFANKFGGSLDNINSFMGFTCKEKLYPSLDVLNNGFVTEVLGTSNLYQSIEDGVIDDRQQTSFSYIQPNTPYSTGDFSYKFQVGEASIRPEESFIVFRATANLENFSSRTSPTYTFTNIKLEDASGTLVVQYKDFSLRGDADFDAQKFNFATYVSEPKINNAPVNINGEEPILFDTVNPSPLTVTFDLNIACNDDPFSDGFDKAYEDTCKLDFINSNDASSSDYLALDGQPISSQQQHTYSVNPSHLIKITAIELCNSGEPVNLRANSLNLYHDVVSTGLRIQRTIFPAEFLAPDFDTGIWPEENTNWISFPDLDLNTYTNASGEGRDILTRYIRNNVQTESAILDFTSNVADSGKLKLRFSHEPPVSSKALSDGSFSFGNQESPFTTAKLARVSDNDSFFVIDEIELVVLAKKDNINVRDFSLDVVGYSDDRLLNITSSVGGFLQNIDGSGSIPLASGFSSIEELGISSESISDKSQYFESTETNNLGGDHYLLSTTPVVSGTEYQEYIIPLRIYRDNVDLGQSTDYSMSSYFENLYLDIFPLPSGACIANVKLVVKHKPSNALQLKVLGGPKENVAHRNAKLFLSPRRSRNGSWIDDPTNATPTILDSFPHSFGRPSTLKTNYAKRWRGVDGTICDGPFNPNEYDFSFENRELTYPFLNGYFSFNRDSNGFIVSDTLGSLVTISGEYIGNYNRVRNIGLRFNSSSLFSGLTTPYTTIDWTSASGYENDAMFGLINDSFDNAVRVSGDQGYIDFGNVNTSSGFAIFTRFSPDVTISGVGYNLFNSGVIFAKHDSGQDLEFSLHYNNGNLEAQAVDTSGTIYTITDSVSYDEYSYPLSVVLTYNGKGDQKLRLYIENSEFGSHAVNTENRRLVGSSDEFALASGNSSLTFGYSSGSGVGINAFLTDIGISLVNNLVNNQEDSNALYKELSVDKFFDSIYAKYNDLQDAYSDMPYTKLHEYIDEDVDKWIMGEFRHCHFNQDFYRLTKRYGKDYIIHNLIHDGVAYEDITDILLPSGIPSGVSYHTQVENDFLRFNIGAMPNTFGDRIYLADTRISKALPRGYNFQETAFFVETIIEHDTHNDILWSDGSVGPRLIVSLYTPSKEPSTYEIPNVGLINRHIHYLEPSGCIHKIKSVFDYNNLLDTTSEPWSNFNQSLKLNEFIEKFYSTNIDDMFLQYDLVYPSGNSFESSVKIHSCTVKLDNALVSSRSDNSDLSLHSDGKYITFDTLTMAGLASQPSGADFTLFVEGLIPSGYNDEMTLYCSGAFVDDSSISLHTLNIGSLSSFGGGFGSLFGDSLPSLTLYNDGKYIDFQSLNLSLINLDILPLSTGTIQLFTKNVAPKYYENNSINLHTGGREIFVTRRPNANMPLFIEVDSPDLVESGSMNLFINAYNADIQSIASSMSIFTQNYFEQELITSPGKLQRFSWNGSNVGKGIDVIDNAVATLAADDEIRGVQTICYGDCFASGNCEEITVITHDINWSSDTCVDGGILRSLRTYNNPDAVAFNTEVGYSGHFYGIRKYEGLVPDAPYSILVVGQSASADAQTLPHEIINWEYGTLEDVAYSGVKLVGDEPVATSGRQANSQYGKAVDVVGDLAAVGAPFQVIHDASGYALNDAGTVFVYRRNEQPTGADWGTTNKALWSLEAQLNLPSDIVRDSYYSSTVVLENVLQAEARKWKVGQEGRQLGHSLSIAKPSGTLSSYGENKEIIAVGGPSCGWSRTFLDPEPSGINVAIMIFTDRKFQPTFGFGKEEISYLNILENIEGKDILFKYFANPSAKFNVKVAVFQAIATSDEIVNIDFPEPKPDFIRKYNIPRHSSIDARDVNLFQETDNIVYSGILNALNDLFPYDVTKNNNNIPSLVSINIDNSVSLGRGSLEPAIDEFINYYKEYSFASGVRDAFDVQSSGYLEESSDADNWINMAINGINDLINITSLREDETFKLVTQELLEKGNTSLSSFNIPPDSGGAVYIFEKESGVWGLIQTIDSPIQSNVVAPDRFGHAVDFSKDGEVLVIGSPYINNAIRTYEYDPSEKDRMFAKVPSWISMKKAQDTSFGYYFNKYNRYQTLLQELGNITLASKALYAELNDNARYDLRTNKETWGTNPIQEYKLAFEYTYSEIDYGSWKFITDEFAPTSRLGYSVSANYDGGVIAVGAPTDSFDEHEQSTTYYAPARPEYTTWPSYVNTGAVRVFESRKYHPHNLAVDYGKFGNRHYLNSQEQEHQYFIDHMGPIFNSIGIDYQALPFDEVDIPNNAGLAFIITPELDALSDEVLENIQNWLALGDRNLVIVGNDPSYEASGLYRTSNDIANNILARLGSRMRIHPARNEYEALAISGCDSMKLNTIPSFVPTNSIGTYITPVSVRTHGVGDIRVHWPENYNSQLLKFNDTSWPFNAFIQSQVGEHAEAYRSYSCESAITIDPSDPFWFLEQQVGNTESEYSYRTANSKCEMPIVHNGDLRSEWRDWCADLLGKQIIYNVNWPLFFGTVTPASYGCYDPNPSTLNNLLAPKYDAIPIMAAAEYIVETVNIPATPESSGLVTVGFTSVPSNESIFTIENAPSGAEYDFIITSDYDEISGSGGSLSGNYLNINYNLGKSLFGSVFDKSDIFYDPDPYNDKDAILQAAQSSFIKTELSPVSVCNRHNFILSENYLSTNSKVIGIASVETENINFLDQGDDKNRLMYIDLVKQQGRTTLGQMGEWTGRTSFKDAAEDSFLKSVFQEYFKNRSYIVVEENITTQQLTNGTSDNYPYDVLWIASPTALPNNQQLSRIKNWLALGNKKLIITYDSRSVQSIHVARNLFELIGTNIKPVWLQYKNKYAQNSDYDLNGLLKRDRPANTQTNILSVDIHDSLLDQINTRFIEFTGMCGSETSQSLVYLDVDVIDDVPTNINLWRYDAGVTKIEFPVVAGSGYQIFFDLVSEHPTENDNVYFSIGGSNDSATDPELPIIPKSHVNIDDFDKFGNLVNLESTSIGMAYNVSSNNSNGEAFTISGKVQAIGNILPIYIKQTNKNFNSNKKRTVRIASISGVAVPITESIIQTEVPIKEWQIFPGSASQSFNKEVFREISTDNSKYCPAESCITELGNQPIADGPVIVAQEYEVFSNFDAGLNRSRITVISDPSLIQGTCIANENGSINSNNIAFIASLYPRTTFPSQNAGRHYDVAHRIKAPELGSPSRYFQTNGSDGFNMLFNVSGIGIATSGRPMSEMIESFDYENFKHALYPTIGQPAQFINKRTSPFLGDEAVLISGLKESFKNTTPSWGAYSKFRTFIDGDEYVDAGCMGGLPTIMRDKGYDFLDFDVMSSGYPGDLFGYSVLLHGSGSNTTLFVGAPFAGYYREEITAWADVVENTPQYTSISGTLTGYNGGAGSVYMYKKTGNGQTLFGYPTAWECVKKIRPENINIGQDLTDPLIASGSEYLGEHAYSTTDLQNFSIVPDQFGYSLASDSDVLAIGAPGHDFEFVVDEIPNEFVHKEFDFSFNIPERTYYDLGSSGIRSQLAGSGYSIFNNGAIFTYENRIVDWDAKTTDWVYLQKIVPQGYNSRTNSENNYFGKSIAIDRNFRTDSDYVLIAGSPHHKYATSGNHISAQPLDNAGALYVYDAMLRSPGISFADPNSWIEYRVFGNLNASGQPQVRNRVTNTQLDAAYITSGIIRSNYEGEIFLEASGQDFLEKGFIKHRPYVVMVEGEYVFGSPYRSAIRLFTEGKPYEITANMNLFSNASDSAVVYNTLGLYEYGIIDSSSGEINLYLQSEAPEVVQDSGLSIYNSGIGTYTDTITLRIRGF